MVHITNFMHTSTCLGSGMMMWLFARCSSTCKNVWMSKMWSFTQIWIINHKYIQLLPKACLIFYGVTPFSGAGSIDTPKTWQIALPCTLCQHSCWNSNTDSIAENWIFSIPIWLLCNWSSICICNEKGIHVCLPFIATLPIIAISCLLGHYPYRVVSKSFLFYSQLLIMYVCNICCSAPVLIAFLMSSTDVHTGMSIAVLSVYMLMFIPAISWSLPSVWL